MRCYPVLTRINSVVSPWALATRIRFLFADVGFPLLNEVPKQSPLPQA
jgi:hypothetical protein